MRLEDCIITEQDVKNKGLFIHNGNIENFDIEIYGHFNDVLTPVIVTKNRILLSGYNLTSNVGYIIRALIRLLGLNQENCIQISSFRNIPCRIITEKDSSFSNAVGIGNFIDNGFILFNDLIEIDEM